MLHFLKSWCLISERGQSMEYIIQTQQEELVDIERIIYEYGDPLLRLCTIYLKDRQLAEDAVQETFIKVYQKYGTFNGVAQEKTWIMKIAMNTCKNYMRTSWFKRVTTGVNLETVSEEVVDSAIIEQEQQKQLLIEIAGLSYKYKEVILLYYYEEMSTREIAEVLNVKEGSVRVRLQRARERLSIKLKEVNNHEESL